jgi:hypothetical protein
MRKTLTPAFIQKAKDPKRPQIPGLLLFSRNGGKQSVEDCFPISTLYRIITRD